MPERISALNHTPDDFIREVSREAIDFYTQGMSGIYMPGGFKATHSDNRDVMRWRPEDRLSGKFGRFTIFHYDENDTSTPIDTVLTMGTTVGLGRLNRYGNLESLGHYMLSGIVMDILRTRELQVSLADIEVVPADYGATTIQLDEGGTPVVLEVSGASIDFGRADITGRQRTCELFGDTLGSDIRIENKDPEPRSYDEIIKDRG